MRVKDCKKSSRQQKLMKRVGIKYISLLIMKLEIFKPVTNGEFNTEKSFFKTEKTFVKFILVLSCYISLLRKSFSSHQTSEITFYS
jgi:hypothetical protein